jgi:hypothetical protein
MAMKADTLIRNEGMEALANSLGLVDAERFIMLIHKDSFDYTKWRENLFAGMTLEEISDAAMEHQKTLPPFTSQIL